MCVYLVLYSAKTLKVLIQCNQIPDISRLMQGKLLTMETEAQKRKVNQSPRLFFAIKGNY